jgi:hypothetical protein
MGRFGYWEPKERKRQKSLDYIEELNVTVREM